MLVLGRSFVSVLVLVLEWHAIENDYADENEYEKRKHEHEHEHEHE